MSNKATLQAGGGVVAVPKFPLGAHKIEFGARKDGTIILRLNNPGAPGEWHDITPDEAYALAFNLMVLAVEKGAPTND